MFPVFHRCSEFKKISTFVIRTIWAFGDGKSCSEYEDRDYARGKPIFTRILKAHQLLFELRKGTSLF